MVAVGAPEAGVADDGAAGLEPDVPTGVWADAGGAAGLEPDVPVGVCADAVPSRSRMAKPVADAVFMFVLLVGMGSPVRPTR